CCVLCHCRTSHHCSLFRELLRRHRIATRFPSTTLFRSRASATAANPAVAPTRQTIAPAPPQAPDAATHHRCGTSARLSAIPTRTDRKSTRLNSSHVKISYAVFCMKIKHEAHVHVARTEP